VVETLCRTKMRREWREKGLCGRCSERQTERITLMFEKHRHRAQRFKAKRLLDENRDLEIED